METKFILIDKINNLQKEATAIVKFNFESKDYLIYSIKESNENCQIFCSRLILNSEGIYFLDNITPEEKNKLNTIIYNLVILTPTESKKGTAPVTLLNDISDKYSVKVSSDIPEFTSQEYYSNCSFAITNKVLVSEAISFYLTNLENKKDEESNSTVPTWNIPSVDTPVTQVEPTSVPTIEIPVEETMTNNNFETQNIDNSQLPSGVTIPEPVKETNIPTENIPNVSLDIPTNVEQAGNSEPTVIPTEQIPSLNVEIPANSATNPTNTVPVNENNSSISNVAIVSDPTLLNIAGNSEPSIPNNNTPNTTNDVNNQKAGFVINKFIVIGSICLVLAIAVVIVAYILIKQKTTGV